MAPMSTRSSIEWTDSSNTERVAPVEPAEAWLAMAQLVESSAVETGIRDLAHRHDSYLHHTPPES